MTTDVFLWLSCLVAIISINYPQRSLRDYALSLTGAWDVSVMRPTCIRVCPSAASWFTACNGVWHSRLTVQPPYPKSLPIRNGLFPCFAFLAQTPFHNIRFQQRYRAKHYRRISLNPVNRAFPLVLALLHLQPNQQIIICTT